MCNGTLFVFLLTLFLPKFLLAECPEHKIEMNDEERLFNALKCKFKDEYRPVKDYTTPVLVKLRFDIKYVHFDTTKDTLSVHSWVVYNWKDEFLSWNASDYSGIKEMQVKSYDIWSPRMMLMNPDVTYYHYDKIYTICILKYDGIVTCVPRIVYKATCQSQLTNWPYDEQTCTIYFGSWMNKEEHVNLTFYENDPIKLDEFENAPGIQECEEGTHAYAVTNGYLKPERTCDNPEPQMNKSQIYYDFSSCYCDFPTVRDTNTNKCVTLDNCTKNLNI
ncbi:unnamed protein product [Danaus chrysippus]|uniref:(African queen) hypothetical protein n=1 Tax=Danaus chrysippus TaxID=151541 RepID=A0A8J2W7F8_9NEOP|nr:unnamed protein product [Danaus chrysippus]